MRKPVKRFGVSVDYPYIPKPKKGPEPEQFVTTELPVGEEKPVVKQIPPHIVPETASGDDEESKQPSWKKKKPLPAGLKELDS